MTTYTIPETANILAMHTVVHKARPDKYFRVSVVLWLYRRQPILRDYTVRRTAAMKPEDLEIFEAKVQAAQASGFSLPAARNFVVRSMGMAKMGPDRRRASAAPDTKASLESDYNIGIRTSIQKENCRNAGALPSVLMPEHRVLLSPYSN
jgi:hypothetical protein